MFVVHWILLHFYVFAVHGTTRKRSCCVRHGNDAVAFSKIHLWGVFSKLYGLCGRFMRINADGRRIRKNIFVFLNLSGFAQTGPYESIVLFQSNSVSPQQLVAWPVDQEHSSAPVVTAFTTYGAVTENRTAKTPRTKSAVVSKILNTSDLYMRLDRFKKIPDKRFHHQLSSWLS